ncbi:MAG TPA: pyridoxal-phosphate dependent enzyme [Thermoanaerobaculia bacterium]
MTTAGAACLRCRTAYPRAGLPDRCPACGGFWGYPDGLRWSPPEPRERASGLRRWAAALGLGAEALPDRELGGEPVRVEGVTLAQEGSRPRGTFKERGAEVLAAVAARRGLAEVFLDSSGNAGLAVAAACAARGIACRVLVPASTPADKLRRIEAAGGSLQVVPGDRRAAADAAGRLRGRLPYASHVYQPFFLAGVATLAWELEEALGRRDGRVERIVVPSGNGSLLLGLALGFDALVAAGRLPAVPALHAVQLAGYAALSPEGPGEPHPGPPTAAGIAVADPPRREELRRRIAETGGDVTVVTEAEIAAAREDLAALPEGGLPTDPTGAAAWAGLAKRPDLRREGTVVVLTSREPELS